jgi:hypothetical protein
MKNLIQANANLQIDEFMGKAVLKKLAGKKISIAEEKSVQEFSVLLKKCIRIQKRLNKENATPPKYIQMGRGKYK